LILSQREREERRKVILGEMLFFEPG